MFNFRMVPNIEKIDVLYCVKDFGEILFSGDGVKGIGDMTIVRAEWI
jgi:hypothetical protein